MKAQNLKLWRKTEYLGDEGDENVRLGKKVNLRKPIDVDKIPIRRDSFLTNAYHLWERKAIIVGDKLLLVTTPVSIEEKIDWLQRMIESTNARVERKSCKKQKKERC